MFHEFEDSNGLRLMAPSVKTVTAERCSNGQNDATNYPMGTAKA